MQYWLLKTEPGTYSWDDLVRDRRTAWTGVRNFQARNTLRAMRVGDLAFVYHSGEQKALLGIAKIVAAAYPDATARDGDWSAVDVAAVRPLVRPVTLTDCKASAELRDMVLVRNSRLSVQPVTPAEWRECLRLSGTAA
jgi:predicted RNA-binding protein with PUA-like domain